MAGQDLFDFPGRDVLPAADDDVLHAVDHHEIPVFVEAGQVAGPEPCPVDEGRGVGRRVLLPEELFRPPGHDLPFVARRDVAAVLVEESNLVARSHPAVGEAAFVGRIGRTT
jgi:hypothetical protein